MISTATELSIAVPVSVCRVFIDFGTTDEAYLLFKTKCSHKHEFPVFMKVVENTNPRKQILATDKL